MDGKFAAAVEFSSCNSTVLHGDIQRVGVEFRTGKRAVFKHSFSGSKIEFTVVKNAVDKPDVVEKREVEITAFQLAVDEGNVFKLCKLEFPVTDIAVFKNGISDFGIEKFSIGDVFSGKFQTGDFNVAESVFVVSGVAGADSSFFDNGCGGNGFAVESGSGSGHDKIPFFG